MSNDLISVTVKAAELIEGLARQGQQTQQSADAATDRLRRTAEATPQILREAAEHNLQFVSGELLRTVRAGLNAPLDDAARKVQDTVHRLEACRLEMQQAARDAGAATRLQKWVTAGVLSVLAVAVVALAWTAQHYYRQVEQHRIEAELLRAYNQADVFLCEGRLCANVDTKGAKYGRRGEYRPVRPRPAP